MLTDKELEATKGKVTCPSHLGFKAKVGWTPVHCSFSHHSAFIPFPVHHSSISWSQRSGVWLWSLPFVSQPRLGPKQWGFKVRDTEHCSCFWKVKEKGVSEDSGKGKGRKRSEEEETGARAMLSKTKRSVRNKGEESLPFFSLTQWRQHGSARLRCPERFFSLLFFLVYFMPKCLQILQGH